MLIIGLFYIVVPLIISLVLMANRQPKWWLWLLSVIAFGVVVSYIWVSARWELVGMYWSYIIPIIFLGSAAFSYTRIREPSKKVSKWAIGFSIFLNAVLIIFFVTLNGFAFRGYIQPERVVELASPLRDIRAVVLHGGNSPFINGHYHVRPQNYALDIVGLNNSGKRAKTITGGRVLEGYAIYNQPLYCPCEGTIILAVDQFEDLIPPKTDTENLAGNHVLIDCDGVEVMLGHLKKGSVQVEAGEKVTTETVLGRVGNTGNTSEPHLHIHAERGGDPNTILNGKGVPFTINGEWMVRGSTFEF